MTDMSNWLAQDKFEKKDEYYTPKILVDAILPFIPKDKVVWCPFDTAQSEFVLGLTANGNAVIHTHIWQGEDFFHFEPDRYDIIISNPPFTKKLKVFERLYNLGKPFAMISGLPILNYQEIGEFFVDKDLQLLIVDKKVSFDGATASFNNSYFCRGILPRDLMFVHLDNNNSRSHYVPSRMYQDAEQYLQK